MELSILYIFIEHNKYYGILKFSIKRDYHNLIINNDVYQINTNDTNSIEIFKNNLLSDPNNPNLLDIIPTRFLFNIKYNFIQAEEFLDYIKSIVTNKEENYRIAFNESLSCVLNLKQLKRIYNFFNSFVSNFALLDSVYKIYLSMFKEDKQEDIKTTIVERGQDLVKDNPPVISPPSVVVKTEEKDLVSSILEEYGINNILRSYIINHLFDHLRYVKVEISNDNTITIENLFSDNYVSNYEYILSILNTTLEPNLSSIITFNQKKIIDQLSNQQEDKLIISLLLFIFYLYQYRYIALKYSDYDFTNYFKVTTQENGINYFIKNLAPEKSIKVKVIEKEENEKDLDFNLIENLSEKYKHLIPVSQEEFLDFVEKEYNESKSLSTVEEENSIVNKFFISLNSKIININNLMNANNVINKIISQNSNITINTLNYQNHDSEMNLAPAYNNKIITKTYYYFKQYVDNPLIIDNIINTATNIDKIPKSVINLFDFFKRNIHKLFSNPEDVNTFSYYKILKQNIPSSKKYSHNIFLYLIYHLIIPYYYDVYKKDSFQDYFLLI